MIRMFKNKLKKYHLLDSNKKILLAVSGGPDSVVLLDLISQIPTLKRSQVIIAHMNHHLRIEANSEEEFVKKLAEKYNLPFYSHQWLEKDHPNSGIEEAARKERYNFFRSLMIEHDISYLMTGHHLDDQIETILMRLTRGASLEQLLGIRSKQSFSLGNNSAYLIRPLLEFSKEEIYQYAKKNGLAYAEDESNQGLDYTRNRFRNKIIPLLKEENSKFSNHMKQFQSDLTDLIEISQEPIDKAYKELVQEKNNRISLDLIRFEQYSSALQKAVITEILKKIYTEKAEQYKTNYIEIIYNWLNEGEVNSSLDLLGDYLVEKEYVKAIFKEKSLGQSKSENVEIEINKINQKVQLSESESIEISTLEKPVKTITKEQSENQLIIAADHLHLPLTVRHRKPGDRMTYKGLSGSKKIKDILIDDKIKRKNREKAWLVEDNKKQIIWLISHRKMCLFTDSETDKLFYKLDYTKNNKELNEYDNGSKY